MVDRNSQRSRYVASSDGAPPVPPAGGYRGARRASTTIPDAAPTALGGAAASASPAEPRPRASGFASVALIIAGVFCLTLVIMVLVGATDALYGVAFFTLQLIVLGLAIAAVATRRGRLLGGIALSLILVMNTATMGALSALRTSATGTYAGQKSTDQKQAESYPGIKGTDGGAYLAKDSLEEVTAKSDEVLSAVRDGLAAELGVTWTQTTDAVNRPERNGYGGESMLVEYISPRWMTNEPVQSVPTKQQTLDVVNAIIPEFGLDELYSFNDPQVSQEQPQIMEKFYGSSDIATQHTWEAYSFSWENGMRLYVTIYDLSQDADGGLRLQREAQQARTGEPLEGIQLFVLAPELLSEDDVPEYEKRLEEFTDESFGG